MTVSRLLSSVFVVLALMASGCGGSAEVTEELPANFAGEYSFVVTGAGGTCADLPPATGCGVEIVSQKDNWATGCFVRDSCDGELCRAGTVMGNVFTSNVQSLRTTGACEVRENRFMVTTRNADGVLDRRLEQHLEYAGGNCSGLVLPCDAWQTSIATPCDNACYEGYCPGGM